MLFTSRYIGHDIFMDYVALEMGDCSGLGCWHIGAVSKHPDILPAFRLQGVLVNRDISHRVTDTRVDHDSGHGEDEDRDVEVLRRDPHKEDCRVGL